MKANEYEAQRLAQWSARFSTLLQERHPRITPDYIDWTGALSYFHAGVAPLDAVLQYCLARNMEEN